MNIKTLLIIVFILAAFGVGGSLYKSDNTQNITGIVENISLNISMEENINYNISSTDFGEVSQKRIINMLCYTIDCIVNILIEVFKWGVEFGYYHPEWDYIWFTKLLIYWYLILTFAVFIPIIPLMIASLYILYEVSKKVYYKLKELYKKYENNKR